MSILAEARAIYNDARRTTDSRTREPRVPLIIQLAALAGRLPRWGRIRTNVLTLSAFGAIDYGVWDQHGQFWGLLSTGISLLVVEALSTPRRGDR